MKKTTVNKLAEMVDGQVVGDSDLVISNFAPLETATESDITFQVAGKKVAKLSETAAGAVLVPIGIGGVAGEEKTLVEVKDVYLAAAIVHNYFLQTDFVAKGIHERAFIGENCSLGKEITVSPLAVVGERVQIGERVFIGPGAVIGDGVQIGDDCSIHANATIYDGCILASRVTIHSGTVIGSDGYGYATTPLGEHVKRPQIGIVRIEDDVEIGANSCVDRAAYGETVVKKGTKIDNLVQVGHNVVVGEHCLLVAQVGISGSTTLGRNVVMGGQAAVAGHIKIGDMAMIAARGGIHSDVESGARLGGAPAIPAKQWAKCCAVYNRLPELQSKVRKIDKVINKMQEDKEK